MSELEGKRVFVTGSGAGIGKAIAALFTERGARVVVSDINPETAKQSAEEIGAAGVANCDVTDEGQVQAAVQQSVDILGGLDVLVNNAGILQFAAIADMALADFRRVLEVNAVGCWLGMKAVIDPMTKAGGGSIVNISSIEGFTGAEGLSAYSASKFAIRGMTKVAARELARFGIRVNSVHPGGVITRMIIDSLGVRDAEQGEAFLRAMPLGRFAEPVEISRLVAYLACDESSYSTGSEFVADGGLLSGPGY